MTEDLLQLRLAVNSLQAKELEPILWQQNAYSVIDGSDTPIFEPDLGTTPLWANTHILALFGSDVIKDEVIGAILAVYPNCEYQFSELEHQDWERAWLNEFKPMNFGQRLWIVPSSYEPPNLKAVNLFLDPGLAFGTGTHPSTALCLRWLDANFKNLQNLQVIDYGCGSGVLAIAALLLGAKKAVGFDIDPQALEASRSNARRNNIVDLAFELYLATCEQRIDFKADILLANILANPLIELAPKLVKLVKTGAKIVLAGILAEQTDEVKRSYQVFADGEIEVSEQEGWVSLSFTVGRF